MKMWKRWTAGALAAVMLSGLLTVGASAAGFSRSRTYTPGQFTDVANTAWYAPSVKDCYELGLMSGASATAFNPTGMFTLAEAATIAARMHSIYQGGSGTVPSAAGAWYQGAVDYCVKNKIFAPGDFADYTRPATRAEMAGMIAAALPESAWTAKNSVSALPDVSAGTPNSEAIFRLYNAGVFTGSDAYGQFQPYAQITRAEVAAIVARCADPAQRKTLSLTPLSQREAPELLGGYNSDARMSNGRLKFQDPETKKWGYLDGNGNVVIAPVYDKAENFENGFAKVEANKGKYGLIDLNGNVVVPIEQYELSKSERPGVWYASRKKYGQEGIVSNGKLITDYLYDEIKVVDKDVDFYRVKQDGKRGAVNSGGKVIVPIHYDAVSTNGFYSFGTAESGVDVYDLKGTKLCTLPKGTEWKSGNHLLSVKEGNKYALYSVNGPITEAIYDGIYLYEDFDLAEVSYGDKRGVVGLNGVIIEPVEYDLTELMSASNGYQPLKTYVGKEETGHIVDNSIYKIEIYSASGKEREYTGVNNGEKRFWAHRDGKCFVIDGYCFHTKDLRTVIDRNGKVYDGYYGRHDHDKEEYSVKSGLRFLTNEEGHNCYYYLDTSTGEVLGPYETREERKAALEEMGLVGTEPDYQIIQQNSSGKPIVEYGNDTEGWIPVIEYYKNNLYYDEIKELGEEYYACRYNTTWYLVHA